MTEDRSIGCGVGIGGGVGKAEVDSVRLMLGLQVVSEITGPREESSVESGIVLAGATDAVFKPRSSANMHRVIKMTFTVFDSIISRDGLKIAFQQRFIPMVSDRAPV